ncbi:hypothetical protein G3A43_09355 [Paraburkholderia aspalathi]|nr:hypothetical protein [Paraburkholderia aspalathi]MBK3780432.1 hypothetical protein [Paraburkholderia aspalathi]
MCEQCLTQATMVVKDVIPGFSLMRATQDGDSWKSGWYGLVEINDPTVVFEGPLLRDLSEGMTDEQINALSDDENINLEAFILAGEKFGEALQLDPCSGYRLVVACMAAGFKPQEDGALEFWLLKHLAKKAGI